MTFKVGHGMNKGNSYAKGKLHTSEWKSLASERMKGNTRGFVKGCVSPRKGKKSSKPAWNKGMKMPNLSKENHPNWIDDRTKIKGQDRKDNVLYKEWRAGVYKRDGYKCKIGNADCSGRIEAHHILRWSLHPNLRYDINNGITLCHFHHPRMLREEEEKAPLFVSMIYPDIPHST